MQAALYRADGATEPPGGLLLGEPLQVAKHHRGSVAGRQTGDLGVNRGAEVGALAGVETRRRVNRVEAVEVTRRERPPSRHCPSLPGHPQAHPVEPAAERIVGPQPHRVGLAGEDEKYCLEGVVGRVPVARHPAADAQYHRPMAVHQSGECRLGRGIAPAPTESGQQLGIGQGPDRPGREQDCQVIAARF